MPLPVNALTLHWGDLPAATPESAASSPASAKRSSGWKAVHGCPSDAPSHTAPDTSPPIRPAVGPRPPLPRARSPSNRVQ
jgi:hypothetical protein